MTNYPSPRVILTIDYEPWFALFSRFDSIQDYGWRQSLDAGFSSWALEPILEKLGNKKISFYLVGEIANWYPDIPERIVSAGHELGFHCQVHRPLTTLAELQKDLDSSESWRKKYGVRGYRAPMVQTIEQAYPLLKKAGFEYSSSIYAPSGLLIQKEGIWELPVSTIHLGKGTRGVYIAPRHYSLKLLLNREIPYGSSFTIGFSSRFVLQSLEKDMRMGYSPVIFLHPYEIARSAPWAGRIWRNVLINPHLIPFAKDKSGFLSELLKSFSISTLGAYLDELLKLRDASHA